jgi:molybdopterin-synthase adenylyltransferase
MKLDIPSEPRLRALRTQLVEREDGVILKRGRVEMKISGQGAAEVVQTVLLTAADGATVEDICDQFAGPARPAVERLVRELEARRLLVATDGLPREINGTAEAETSLEIFLWHFGEPVGQALVRLNQRRLTIVGVNSISRQLAVALSGGGVHNFEIVDYPLLANLRLFDDRGQVDAAQWPRMLPAPTSFDQWRAGIQHDLPNCLIATTDCGALHLFRRWNELCMRNKWHFLPVAWQDLVGYVGPLVVPGETACYECLRARQNSHLSGDGAARAAEERAFEAQAVTGFHPSMASILGDIAALELARFYAGWPGPRIVGNLIEVNLLGCEMTPRRVLRVPRCTVCSNLLRHGAVTVDREMRMPGNEEVYA